MKAEWKVVFSGGWSLYLGEYISASIFASDTGDFVVAGKLLTTRFPTLSAAQRATERAVLTYLHEEVAALTDLVRGKEANT